MQKNLKLALNYLMNQDIRKSADRANQSSLKNEIQHFTNQITSNKTIFYKNKILTYKDQDLVYRAHNENAEKLGSKKHGGILIGLTDEHINHEFTEKYIALDQQAILTRKPVFATEKVLHHDFGYINAFATIFPLIDESGKNSGVFIESYIDLSLKNQPFPFIINALSHGHAHQFLQQDNYKMKLLNSNVTLTKREMECILYLLIGLNTKIIAQHMVISPRTVDNMIDRLKEKLNLPFRQDIASCALTNQWLNYL